ncbi:MAG: RNA polymerase sigma factor [Henriciella sp.]|nr:sigma-70 family RNA polymerase sigma factor [Hyphomonadaceae bacterium]
MKSDLDLAREAASGQEAAFETLVRRYQGNVRGLTRRLTAHAAEADDVAQTAFLTAWRKIGSYRGGSFKSWLCTIAYREFLQARRRQKPEVTFDESAHIIGFDASAARLPEQLDLDRALRTLPENQRICVVLCVASGMSHSEASEATGFPLGTVKSHVNRGVAALRKQLASDHVA